MPVAVAKQCGKADGCTADYNLERVQGHSDQSGRSRVDRERINALRSTIAAGNEVLADGAARKVTIKQQLADVASLNKIQKDISDLESATPAGPRVLTAAEEQDLQKLKASEARIKGLNPTTLQGDLKNLEASLIPVANKVVTAETELKALLAQKDEERGDVKIDALSVYGTFSGDAAGGDRGGGLKLGNTFSTGIAAQFIAQGLKDAAPMKAVEDCFAVSKPLIEKIPDDKKGEVLTAIAKACESTQPKKTP